MSVGPFAPPICAEMGESRSSARATLHLQDISKDQNVLLSAEDFRDQQLLVDTATGKVQDVSTFPYQLTGAISPDGRTLLFGAYVTGATSDYNLYTQQMDGSSPAMIGQGWAMALSSDGRWALSLDPANIQHLRIIPTGMGEGPHVDPSAGPTISKCQLDGRRVCILLVVAAAPGHAPATYLQEIATGAARQITGEGKYTVGVDERSMSVSPDGKFCIITDGEDHYWVQPIDGSEASELKGLLEGDHPLQWHKDSQNIFFERT